MSSGHSSANRLRPPDPPLANDRVVLRPIVPEDAAVIAAACDAPEIPRFTFMPEGLDEPGAKKWIDAGHKGWRHGIARLAITEPGEDRLLGQVGAAFEWPMERAEVFYWLDRQARGRGLASAAVELVTRWAFDTHVVRRVQLGTLLENADSQRVAERCGFTREGVLRSWVPVKDPESDMLMWSRLPGDPGLGELDDQ